MPNVPAHHRAKSNIRSRTDRCSLVRLHGWSARVRRLQRRLACTARLAAKAQERAQESRGGRRHAHTRTGSPKPRTRNALALLPPQKPYGSCHALGMTSSCPNGHGLLVLPTPPKPTPPSDSLSAAAPRRHTLAGPHGAGSRRHRCAVAWHMKAVVAVRFVRIVVALRRPSSLKRATL